MGIILILVGIFTAGMAYSNADWYFSSGKAKLWVSVLGGRENARIALMVIGVIIIIAGLFYR
ncbi:MAG: hypothetical protein H6672_12280 [Anaerolineaceae bacterium]|nr:hypothetical protein [Anaerolineaceae bacterium]